MPAIHTRRESEDRDSDIVKVSPPRSVVDMDADHKIKIEMVEDASRGGGGYDEIKVGKEKQEVDVQKMVDETVRKVREHSDRIQAAAMPYANKTRSFAERQPVLFTFLALFAVLSIIPLCCFAGFVLSATLFVLGVAAVGICVSVLGLILLASTILLPTLFFTSLVSLTILCFLLVLFLAHRLYLHIMATTTTSQGTTKADYENLSKGVKAWMDETTARIPEMPFDVSSLSLGGSKNRSQYNSGRTATPKTSGVMSLAKQFEYPSPNSDAVETPRPSKEQQSHARNSHNDALG